MTITEGSPVSELSLPAGFRFYPTDEELIVHYLRPKIAGQYFPLQIISEVDLYKFEPWILPSKACFGENERYFFSPRYRKYPNGSRPNRVAASGYWKATGTDKVITSETRNVGIKKALVFYGGKAPKGTKTNWIMHEYRLPERLQKKNGSSLLDDWVLCRIYKKISKKENSSLSEIKDQSFTLTRMNSSKPLQDDKSSILNVGAGNFDWDNLGFIESLPEFISTGAAQVPENGMYVKSGQPLCYVDSQSDKFGSSIEDEVESGLVSQNIGFFEQNSGGVRQFSDPVDIFGVEYAMDETSGRFGFF